ncbi:MAG: TonB-dependent receptor domain-containing protein [Steroidobacteraceae bacterium]
MATAGNTPATKPQSTNLPAQTLRIALQTLAKERGLQIVYRADLVKGVKTPGVHGNWTTEQTLDRLLQGTGLTYVYLDRRAVTIIPIKTARTWVVVGQTAAPDPKDRQNRDNKKGSSSSDPIRLAEATAGPSRRSAALAAPSSQVSLAANPSSRVLQQVVVTATRRATAVQTTPISITAVTAAEIASRGIADLDTLGLSVPGLSMKTFGPGYTEFEMRGLNSEGGNTSMVGLYLNDVPLSSPTFGELGRNVVDPSLYDLSRVEVLRGPQGTLYGSSSMGGAIRLIPAEPQLHESTASIQEVASDTLSGGNINHQENAMVNLPLGDDAAVRVVGSFTRDSGWLKRLVFADGAVGVDSGAFPEVARPSNFYSAPLQEVLSGVNTTGVDSIRAEFLWQPTNNLTIEPMAMYQLTQQGASNTVDVNGDPTNPQTPTVKGHYEIYDTPEPQQDSFSFGSLKAVYGLPLFSLTSISGFFHRNHLTSEDATEETSAAFGIPVYDASAGGAGPLGPEPNGPGAVEQDYTRQLSEEFRLTSTAPGPFQWVAGYFFQDLHSEFNLWMEYPQGTPVLGGINAFVQFEPQVLIQNSFFGNASWRFSPHFKIEAGFRHYHYGLTGPNEEYGTFTPLQAQGNSARYISLDSIAQSGAAPSVTLTYNIDHDHMVYFTTSKGFRLGGINQPVPVAYSTNSNASLAADECALQAKLLLTSACNPNLLLKAPTTFSSDSVWSYELGEKSYFLDHRMLADLDAYWETWQNPQLATNLAGFGLNANSGSARIKGVEVQLKSLLPAGFDVSLNGAYTDAQIVEGSAIIGLPAGTEIPDTPKVMASAVLHWAHYLQTDGDLSLFGSLEEDYTGTRTDVPYGETLTLDNFSEFLVHLPAYSMVNLRFGVRGVRSDGDQWSATLFVDNLTNNQVLLDPMGQITFQTTAFQRETISQPLTAGLDVTYHLH